MINLKISFIKYFSEGFELSENKKNKKSIKGLEISEKN